MRTRRVSQTFIFSPVKQISSLAGRRLLYPMHCNSACGMKRLEMYTGSGAHWVAHPSSSRKPWLNVSIVDDRFRSPGTYTR